MCTFWTLCSHVCELNLSWKVLENEFCESWKTLEFSRCKSWKVLENSCLLSVRTLPPPKRNILASPLELRSTNGDVPGPAQLCVIRLHAGVVDVASLVVGEAETGVDLTDLNEHWTQTTDHQLCHVHQHHRRQHPRQKRSLHNHIPTHAQ